MQAYGRISRLTTVYEFHMIWSSRNRIIERYCSEAKHFSADSDDDGSNEHGLATVAFKRTYINLCDRDITW